MLQIVVYLCMELGLNVLVGLIRYGFYLLLQFKICPSKRPSFTFRRASCFITNAYLTMRGFCLMCLNGWISDMYTLQLCSYFSNVYFDL
jgi:hypothetical protein